MRSLFCIRSISAFNILCILSMIHRYLSWNNLHTGLLHVMGCFYIEDLLLNCRIQILISQLPIPLSPWHNCENVIVAPEPQTPLTLCSVISYHLSLLIQFRPFSNFWENEFFVKAVSWCKNHDITELLYC